MTSSTNASVSGKCASVSKNTTSMEGATLVTRSMSTMSSNDAASTRESPNVSRAQRIAALAGADSKPSLTTARSSALVGSLLT